MRIVPTLARLVLAGFVVSLALALAAGFGKQFGAWDFRFGFQVLSWGVFLGIGTLVVGLVWLVARLITGSGASTLWGVVGLVGAALVVAIPLHGYYTAKYLVPPIHDITTDIQDPPQFRAVLPLRTAAINPPAYDGTTKMTWQGKTLTVAEWQRKSYPDIFTARVLITPDRLYERGLRAARKMGWHIVLADEKNHRIEATDTSLFFGFTDDIAIRVAKSGMGAKLDIRSESRVGVSDIGKNAARIRAFMKALAAMG